MTTAIDLLPVRSENCNAVAYVCTSPEEGAAQLEILKSLGCQPHHRVLEIGCGGLVAGFPVMQYLDAGNYAGIDPNTWLYESSLKVPDVVAVVAAKRPRFFARSDFKTDLAGERFDFIFSHSILSHASDSQLTAFFAAAADQLAEGGVLAASLRLADGNEFGSPGSARHGAAFTEWQYPGVSWFTKEDVLARARAIGLETFVDLDLTRTILKGNPKAIHDWIRARRTRQPIMLGVPVFREEPSTLVETIHSFLDPAVRVVVVDNGASTECAAVLSFFERNGKIEVIHNAENRYVNPAWNQLAERFLESACSVLVLANADLVVSSGWAASLLEAARSGPAIWRGRGVKDRADLSAAAPELSAHTAGAFFALARADVARALPIPDALKIWCGDDWIWTFLDRLGRKQVAVDAIRAWHAESVSSSKLPEFAEVANRDLEAWRGGLARECELRAERALRAADEPTAPDVPEQQAAAQASKITLVTAFFRLRDRSVDENEMFRQFDALAASGLPIILFLDADLPERVPSRPNVRVVPLRLESLWPFQQPDKPLPDARTPEKDTSDFLRLQNAKLDLLDMARKINADATHFAWIDFAVMKIVKDRPSFVSRLRALRPPAACILTPGCWTKERAKQQTNDGVNWRFCGGFLVVDRATVPLLVARYHEVFRRSRQLTWEVNTWAEMERRGQRFDWYEADHDDTLIGTRTPRVCLVMIVKNERAIIERCLAAALPSIDCWAIADTGSTDGTAEAIERFFADRKIPGKLGKTTFRDFAQARNESLDLALTLEGWDYALLIDADMVLVGAVNRSALKDHSYHLKQVAGTLGYWNTRLVRRDTGARYVGVTHEFVSVPDPAQIRLDTPLIDDRNDGGSKGDKSERDIRLLNDGLVTEPNNGRYMFYLANTYREIGRHAEAIQWYTRRIAASGWDEEVWASYYGIARSWAALDDERVVLACLRAYGFRPTRAEPLALLASWLRGKGGMGKLDDAALLVAEQVARIPETGDILFVEQDVYARRSEVDVSISGYWSKLPERRLAGYDACARLTIDPDKGIRDQARGNFVHYAKSAQELFAGTTLKRIDCTPQGQADGYVPMNPSILIGPGGRRLVLIRTVNYRVADGQYPTIDGSNVIRTKNWITEVDNRWEPAEPKKMAILTDRTGLPRSTYPVDGFEDCRLFLDYEGKLAASATVRDLADSDGRCEMALLSIDDEYAVKSIRVVRDYDHDRAQKNWMPVLGHPNRFLYLCHPTVVVDAYPTGTREVSRIDGLSHNLTEFRGGSQVIPHGDGWICLVHEVVFTPARVYLHRFVRLSEQFEITVVSAPFVFTYKGIEFAAGLARDGNRLVASFGVNDASAYIAFFDSATVDQVMKIKT